MSKERLAELLVLAVAVYNDHAYLRLSKDDMNRAIRRLHAYGVLSTPALSAITGVSMYRVRKAIAGMTPPRARGHLNPIHLTELAYLLSMEKQLPSKQWLQRLVNGGTNLSTISDLTGISEATIYRRLNDEGD